MRPMLLLGLALVSLFPSALPAESPAMPAPVWMAGAWVETHSDRWTEEFWTPMRGGLMIGAGRSGRGDTLESWEATRIARDESGTLVFWGSPEGGKPVPFKAVSSTATEIVFANPSHDYPQRIRYWREAALLHAEISLADGSKAMRWTYKPAGKD